MIALVAVGTNATPATAVDNGTLGIRPSNESDFFHISLYPGAAQDAVAIVSNRTNAPVTLLSYPVDALTTAQGGFAFSGQATVPTKLGAWVSMLKPSIQIPANSDLPVNFRVSVPEGTLPGEYAGGIVIQSPPVIGNETTNTSGAVVRMDVVQRQAVRIYLKVAGEASQQLEVSPLSWNLHDGAIAFTMTMRNTGNTILHPEAELMFSSMFGGDRPVQFSVPASLLPGANVEITAHLPKAAPFDSATAIATVSSTAGLQKSSATVLYASLLMKIIGASGLLLLIFIGWQMLRIIRRARKAIAELELSRQVRRYPVAHGTVAADVTDRRSVPRETVGTAIILSALLTITGLLGAPTAAHATTVSNRVLLGAAENFSVLGNAITSTGATSLNLSLGVTPGTSITGFPPGTIGGSSHSNDATAIQAQQDLQTAYNTAAGRTSTATIAGDLNGRTLTAGVYTAAAAIAITGTLTLDAQGNCDSVFIFQVDAALNAAAGAQIVLTNGALSSRVFWQIAGAVTIGASGSWTGMILGGAAITVGALETVAGAVLTTNGAVTLGNNQIVTSIEPPAIITATTTSASMASVTLTGKAGQMSTGVATQWSVVDHRDTGAPWTLSVAASDLTSAGGTVETTPRVIAAANLSIIPGVISAGTCGSSTSLMSSGTVVLTSIPQALVSSPGDNRGTYLFTPTFNLEIPANAYRSNYSGTVAAAVVNPYTTTITATVG